MTWKRSIWYTFEVYFSSLFFMSSATLWVFLSQDFAIFLWMIVIFVLLRYMLEKSIEEKKHQKTSEKEKKDLWLYFVILVITLLYAAAIFFGISWVTQTLQFTFSVLLLYLGTLFFHRQILLLYGEEVEVSGQKYFKKWYKVSLFSLFVNILAALLAIFLFIHIFNLDSVIEIGGLWAGILAFIGFTAPVWALDMVAGIIMLQSKNLETGNVFYISEDNIYVWIKVISLTEVKCIDLRTGNPILYRPSQFRNLALKNLSQGIAGKTSKILQEIEIYVDYTIPEERVRQMCYDAYDEMFQELTENQELSHYFGDESYRTLEIDAFWDYAVKYKFFYSISSGFYVYKALRHLNHYLLKQQQKTGIYFATPDLVSLEQKTLSQKIST